MPSFDELKPFLVLGFALGGVFAMSGVGLVVLYRATGVLNLAYGAIGATGALITWSLIDNDLGPHWLAYPACIAFGGVRHARLRVALRAAVRRPRPAGEGDRDARLPAHPPRADAVASTAPTPHAFTLPTSRWHYVTIGGVRVTLDADHRHGLPDHRHRGHGALPAGDARSARRCGRWPTTARSPPCSACPCAGSRRRRGSAPGSSAASPACCSRNLVGLDIVTPHLLRHPGARGGADRPAALAVGHADRRLRHRPRPVVPRRAEHDLGELGRVPHHDAVRAGHRRPPLVRPASAKSWCGPRRGERRPHRRAGRRGADRRRVAHLAEAHASDRVGRRRHPVRAVRPRRSSCRRAGCRSRRMARPRTGSAS